MKAKIILKKTLWFTVISTLCLIIVTLFTTCDSNELKTSPTVCNFENPLTDLPWLKAKVDEITLSFQGNLLTIAIYQCIYGNQQTGFLEDRGTVKFFYNCEGEILCTIGDFAPQTCPELNIDWQNKQLIWEINN